MTNRTGNYRLTAENHYITITVTSVAGNMSETIVVGLTDGREIEVDELTVLERDNGAWIRCIRAEPSRRMAFDETTTYYHLESDVEYVVGTGCEDADPHEAVDRLPTPTGATARGTGDD